VLQSLDVAYEFKREQARSADGRLFLFINSPRREMGFATDGENNWAWLPRAKQYGVVSSAELNASGGHWAYGSPARVRAELSVLLDTRYGKLGDRAPTATYEGREKLKTSQGKVECYIIEMGPGLQPGRLAQPPPGYTGPSVLRLWIGVEDGLIWKELERKPLELRSDRMVSISTTWEVMEIDQPVATGLFRYKPASDMKQVAVLDLPPPPTTVRPGAMAPNFSLPAAGADASLSLSSLRGKVVLVDFWTTWCPPCQFELPALERIYRDWKARGLEVVGVSDEQPDVVQGYREAKGLTFPTVVDVQRAAYNAFQVYALPTVVVIDRGGKITNIMVGGKTDAELRAALEAAGL
jgi:peroxiredoxin